MDDEERRLESFLFGVSHEDNVEAEHDDDQLFFIDDGLQTQPISKPTPWTDGNSDNKVSLLSGPSRRRKLRLSQQEDTVTEQEYETRLRAQFERINPQPEWAKQARKKNREEREARGLDDEHIDQESAQNLFTSTNGILKAAERRKKSLILPSGTISIERLRDANLEAQAAAAGEVKVVSFHPSEKVPVLCVATADRRVRLYNVDGHTSPLLQTLHIPSLPLTSSTSALFHPSGTSLLLSGPRPFFFTHDLQTGLTTRHDRGLWGTTFTHSSPSFSNSKKRSRNDPDSGADSIHLTSFSPTGELLAVAAGKGAQVHLVDWKSGAGQVVSSFNCSGGGAVQGLWWFNAPSPLSSSHNPVGILGDDTGMAGLGSARQHLAVLTSDAEMYLWDIGERRCVRRWKDEGGFRGAGRVLAGTTAGANGGYLGIGSSSGFVNVYSSTSLSLHPTEIDKTPKPMKTIGNLITPISTLKFNHDAQLLAIASKDKKDAMRLIHLPTLTSFANWPTSSTPLGRVTAVDFSVRSEYMAIGNTRGRVLLYHLREYGAGGM